MSDPKKKGISFNMTGGRWFVLGVAALGGFAAFVTYSIHQRDHGGIAGSARVAPNTLPTQNIAGSADASPKYVSEIKSMNTTDANAAMQSGSQAFVATPVIDPSGKKLIDTPPNQSPQSYPDQQQPSQNQSQPHQAQVNYQRPQPDQAVSSQIQALSASLALMRSGQTTVVYSTKPVESSGATATTRSGTVPDSKADQPESILPAGSLIYGVFETRLQSDVPGPVLGTLVQGKWNGYKVMGKFENIAGSNLLSIHLTQLVAPDASVYPIDAYAISPDTTLPAMATDVDRHVFSRTASFAGAAFLAGLQGYGQALAQSGSTMVTGLNGTVTSYPAISSKQLIGMAAGSASQGLQAPQQALVANIVQPNTITVKEGTPFVLLTVKGADKK